MYIPEAFGYVQHIFKLAMGAGMEERKNLFLKTRVFFHIFQIYSKITWSSFSDFHVSIGILVMMEIDFLIDLALVYPFTKCNIKMHLSHKTKKKST